MELSWAVKKRHLALAALFLGLSIFGYTQLASTSTAPVKKDRVEKPVDVEVLRIKNRTVTREFSTIGRLAASQEVVLYAQVSGVSLESRPAFKPGTAFKKGAVMLRIRDSRPRYQMLARKSQFLNLLNSLIPDLKIDFPNRVADWRRYINAFQLDAPIAPLPQYKTEQEKLFLVSRGVMDNYYTLKGEEEVLGHYTIYAPYTGVLLESSVKTGELIRQGQALGRFQRIGNYELLVSVSLKDLNAVAKGNRVRLSSAESDRKWEGTIVRRNRALNPRTQTVDIFISVAGEGLYDGMFLTATIESNPIKNVAEIPRESIYRERYVYLVNGENAIVRRGIDVLHLDDTAIVRGIPDGALLVLSPPIEAHDGLRITPVLTP